MKAQDSNPQPSKYGTPVLTNLMNKAAALEMYEEAAAIRDRIKAEEESGGLFPHQCNIVDSLERVYEAIGAGQ